MIRSLSKKTKIILGIIIFLIVVFLLRLLIGKFIFNVPYIGTAKEDFCSESLDTVLTKKQVKEDLQYVYNKLRKKHPAWLEDSNDKVVKLESKYQEELASLENNNSDTITVLDEWRIIGSILHELQDGHTRVTFSDEKPTYIDDFSQINQYGLPVKINGESTKNVYSRFSLLFQYETEGFLEYIFEDSFVKNKNYLAYMGVDTKSGVTFTFDTEDGTVDYHYDFVPYEDIKGAEKDDWDNWVYYEISADNKVGIFTLNSCDDNEEYLNTLQSFFDDVHKAGVENIIVDLRSNGGGNSYVANEFLRYIDVDGYNTWACDVRYGPYLKKYRDLYIKNERKEPLFSGNIYVLTSPITYSAAMDFAMLIGDNNIGKLVGEPSGNLPDCYGDCLDFCIPNSKLELFVSFKKWYRVDQNKSGGPLNPDYLCDENDAMDKAFEIINDNLQIQGAQM
ncbi:Peptidase family S41 [Pseudobutyrivibrio sp. ACV-2]|uniref:S41 family peptidase n=1 Tax=Pseudobutyrivibrio sp. ACV-2 TaxID=1520801 RepID=UPI0008986C17|nr:S41 family peptidase [Pseudobutyrivibrio sp. ACV-2]SEA87649.1 Peptidase family S41 [Pseudobutyrivibrio sp. ACV-2]